MTPIRAPLMGDPNGEVQTAPPNSVEKIVSVLMRGWHLILSSQLESVQLFDTKRFASSS